MDEPSSLRIAADLKNLATIRCFVEGAARLIITCHLPPGELRCNMKGYLGGGRTVESAHRCRCKEPGYPTSLC